MPVRYGLHQYSKITEKNSLKQTEFLSGKRKALLDKMFFTKGTRKGVYPPIGLNILKLDSIVKKKTRNGIPMYVLAFKKEGERIVFGDKSFPFGWYSFFNNTIYPYLPLMCYHIIRVEKSVDFAHRFYEKFTDNLAEKDLLKLTKGLLFKGIVRHIEEPWILSDGSIKTYDHTLISGFSTKRKEDRIGEPMIFPKPEIAKLYHIDTPDSEIEIKYSGLFKPYKK